ncbi:Down syndrome cell adhesion molecule homolog [Limulus polyphemus]|uniref:Down syndrome cell adhesion molecule homolog n=1 Tax=Limulus polyphemus TaxID=6850 RepID=A0ABM1S0I0_LIMPO|nr:Down syndrome cell adhesion molecule homolog [Limulus polyphemus]
MTAVVWFLTALSVAGCFELRKRYPSSSVFSLPYLSSSSNFTVTAGETAVLDCPFGAAPGGEVSWEKDGRRLPDNQRQRIYPNGSLIISNVNRNEDVGHFECSGSTQGSPVSRKVITLNVKVAPAIDPFSFKSDLYEGSRAAVTCVVVAGDPPISMKWLKDGRQLNDGDHGTSVYVADDGYVSTLTLNNLSRRNNGNYTCKASNSVGTDSSSAQLEVKAPPHWTKPPVDSDAILGRSVMLHCQAEGHPAPHIRWKVAKGPPHFVSRFSSQTVRRGDRATIRCNSIGESPIYLQWLVNGNEFNPSDRRSYIYREDPSPEGTQAEITIPSTTRDDSAIYTCIARNDYGEDRMNIQVNVQEVPDTPHNIRVEKVTSHEISLIWSLPYNGNSEITEFQVQWREEHDQWSQVNQKLMSGTETAATISNLKPQTRYRFRVRATNSIGVGRFSNAIQEETAAEPPRTAPSGIRAVAVNSRAILVSWMMLREPGTGDFVKGYYVGIKPRGSSQPFTYRTVVLRDEDLAEQEISGLERNTDYVIVVQAFNNKGPGPSSDEVYVRTPQFDRPSTPMLKVSVTTATSITVTWDASSDPDCPVSKYILNYKMEGTKSWQQINIHEDENTHTLLSLDCGAIYQFYLVAINVVGKSEPSQTISAKTAGHEFPTGPSEMTSVNFLYRHLTVTVPVASSVLVLIVVFIVVCQVTRRRSPGPRTHSPEGTENSEQIKPDNMSLTVTYDSNQEPAYLPAPYATTKIPVYSRDQGGPLRGGSDPGMRTFGSSRHLYDVPNPNRRMESKPVNSSIVISDYQKTALLQVGQQYLNKRSRNPIDNGKRSHKRDFGDGSSGSESEDEIRATANRGLFKEHEHDVVHGSEMECDRQCKNIII